MGTPAKKVRPQLRAGAGSAGMMSPTGAHPAPASGFSQPLVAEKADGMFRCLAGLLWVGYTCTLPHAPGSLAVAGVPLVSNSLAAVLPHWLCLSLLEPQPQPHSSSGSPRDSPAHVPQTPSRLPPGRDPCCGPTRLSVAPLIQGMPGHVGQLENELDKVSQGFPTPQLEIQD